MQYTLSVTNQLIADNRIVKTYLFKQAADYRCSLPILRLCSAPGRICST